MRLRVYFLAATLIAASDQIICTLGPNANSYNAYSDERPSPDAMQLAGPVNESLAAACRPNCPKLSLFRNTTASNAMLLHSGGQWKIVYKPDFFTRVYESYGDVAIQVILAHELGHAIDATTRAAWIKGEWGSELRADAWTGCSLARLNLNPKGLKTAFEVLSKYPPVPDPGWTMREQALKLGLMQCGSKK